MAKRNVFKPVSIKLFRDIQKFNLVQKIFYLSYCERNNRRIYPSSKIKLFIICVVLKTIPIKQITGNKNKFTGNIK